MASEADGTHTSVTRKFSYRYQTRRPGEGLIDGQVPDRVRTELKWITREYAGERWHAGEYSDVHIALLRALGEYTRQLPDRGTSTSRAEEWADVFISPEIDDCNWDTFYDVVEVLFEHVRAGASDHLHKRINEMLLVNHLAYEVRDGNVERVGARASSEVVAQARTLLTADDLAGPDEQFQKAVGFYNQRPKADVENCVKEAVGAAEGVARVLLDKPSILLNKAVDELGKRKGVHAALQKLIKDLYAFRGTPTELLMAKVARNQKSPRKTQS